MNNSKSEIFFNGMQEELQQDILVVSGFQEGTMPFKYLGVPIQPGKMSKKDCQCLIEKMVTKIRSLGAKKLSYAGRVVLINSVLNTLYNYWAAMFIIPKSVIKRVEAICRNFLWSSSSEYHRVPLVGWDRVTLPKGEGGLGIKKAELWNVASVGKLVNWLYIKPNRLWIKWVANVYLKGAEYHDYTPGNDTPWTWKSICKVKEKIKNGFHDNLWVSSTKGYSISNGYEWLMGQHPKTAWSTLVWNNWNIPKHSMVAWMIMQDGLNLKTKLHAIGLCPDDECILCGEQPETSNHLFSECRFTCKVKDRIAEWIGKPMPDPNALLSANKNRMQWKASVCVQVAFWYTIWFQRNSTRHQLCVQRTDIVAQQLKQLIQRRVRSKMGNLGSNGAIDWQASIGFIC
ncbi:uncharacterized protein LOC141602174 [Silene latifolia]|uniref:uncharacterized protein LOC141602174 n=1 Tax=Silene latifolia TaxID=37657 RepID=UPI003D781363